VKNKIEDLRNHLFETLEALKDKEHPMPLDRAKAVSDVAQTIINSAKVEVDFIRAIGAQQGSGFIPQLEEKPVNPGKPQPRLIKGSARQ
jgi:hypothetical protein